MVKSIDWNCNWNVRRCRLSPLCPEQNEWVGKGLLGRCQEQPSRKSFQRLSWGAIVFWNKKKKLIYKINIIHLSYLFLNFLNLLCDAGGYLDNFLHWWVEWLQWPKDIIPDWRVYLAFGYDILEFCQFHRNSHCLLYEGFFLGEALH